MKPTFILGMGAQKAGTSWLHSMLSKNHNVNLGFRKEYHIWDYLFSDLCTEFKAQVKNPDNPDAAMRRMMQKHPDIYIEYFLGLLNAKVNVTGDITPSYSLINESGLEYIASILRSAGFDIKVIFLMRDPVERIWSAVRMEQRNQLSKGHKLDDNFCEVCVKKWLKSNRHIARCDYKNTVKNITNVFGENEIHFELYENLFKKKSIDRLQDFLGFELTNIEFSERVNQSPDVQRSQEVTDFLLDFLAPQYEFCRSKFVEVNGLWHRAR